jgi:two-component system cell cycle sensor histidine kinase/response regulator CckA
MMKILVVDPQAEFQEVLGKVLAPMGHEIITVDGGASVLAVLDRFSAPGMAFVDARTPHGWEVCRSLFAEPGGRRLHVIGLADRGHSVSGLESVADDILLRPFNPEELFARVRIGERLLALERADVFRNYPTMLRQVLDTIPQGVFWKDRAGIYLGCNQVLVRNLGLSSPNEIIGRTDFDLPWPCSEAEAYRADDAQVMESQAPKWHIIEQVQRADGRRIWADTTKLPLVDEHGSVYGVLGVYEDITDHKEREESLARAQRLLEETFEQCPVPMILVSLPDAVLRMVNPACREFLGITDEPSAIGTVLWDFKPTFQDFDASGNPGRLEDLPLARALAGRKTFAEERKIVRKDGTARWEQVYGTPILSTTGEIVAAYLILIDITERKLAEAEQARLQGLLMQAQKMESVGRLAGGVAHDFNNMLGVIIGNADIALSQIAPTHPAREDIKEVIKAAKRSASLVSQLLAFARKQTVAPRAVELNETVERTMKMLGRLIGEDITLTFQPGQDLWQIHVDPAQVDQVLANLVVNARDAISGVGTIALSTANMDFDETWCAQHPGCEPGAFVVLSVADTGCGMDQDVLSHMFEPFFTTKSPGKGTGLGLATVYGVVKQNGGFVTVRSAVNQGTTLALHFPRYLAKDTDIVQGSPADPAVEGGSETVLLVEDELSLLRLGRMMLAQLGYTVLAASTPSEAIQIAEGHARIHLLVTDVVMPEMNGYDLADRLSLLFPDLACLFISGYTGPAIRRRGTTEAGTHFLAKPFTGRDLAVAVRRALRGRSRV